MIFVLKEPASADNIPSNNTLARVMILCDCSFFVIFIFAVFFGRSFCLFTPSFIQNHGSARDVSGLIFWISLGRGRASFSYAFRYPKESRSSRGWRHRGTAVQSVLVFMMIMTSWVSR